MFDHNQQPLGQNLGNGDSNQSSFGFVQTQSSQTAGHSNNLQNGNSNPTQMFGFRNQASMFGTNNQPQNTSNTGSSNVFKGTDNKPNNTAPGTSSQPSLFGTMNQSQSNGGAGQNNSFQTNTDTSSSGQSSFVFSASNQAQNAQHANTSNLFPGNNAQSADSSSQPSFGATDQAAAAGDNNHNIFGSFAPPGGSFNFNKNFTGSNPFSKPSQLSHPPPPPSIFQNTNHQDLTVHPESQQQQTSLFSNNSQPAASSKSSTSIFQGLNSDQSKNASSDASRNQLEKPGLFQLSSSVSAPISTSLFPGLTQDRPAATPQTQNDSSALVQKPDTVPRDASASTCEEQSHNKPARPSSETSNPFQSISNSTNENKQPAMSPQKSNLLPSIQGSSTEDKPTNNGTEGPSLDSSTSATSNQAKASLFASASGAPTNSNQDKPGPFGSAPGASAASEQDKPSLFTGASTAPSSDRPGLLSSTSGDSAAPKQDQPSLFAATPKPTPFNPDKPSLFISASGTGTAAEQDNEASSLSQNSKAFTPSAGGSAFGKPATTSSNKSNIFGTAPVTTASTLSSSLKPTVPSDTHERPTSFQLNSGTPAFPQSSDSTLFGQVQPGPTSEQPPTQGSHEASPDATQASRDDQGQSRTLFGDHFETASPTKGRGPFGSTLETGDPGTSQPTSFQRPFQKTTSSVPNVDLSVSPQDDAPLESVDHHSIDVPIDQKIMKLNTSFKSKIDSELEKTSTGDLSTVCQSYLTYAQSINAMIEAERKARQQHRQEGDQSGTTGYLLKRKADKEKSAEPKRFRLGRPTADEPQPFTSESSKRKGDGESATEPKRFRLERLVEGDSQSSDPQAKKRKADEDIYTEPKRSRVANPGENTSELFTPQPNKSKTSNAFASVLGSGQIIATPQSGGASGSLFGTSIPSSTTPSLFAHLNGSSKAQEAPSETLEHRPQESQPSPAASGNGETPQGNGAESEGEAEEQQNLCGITEEERKTEEILVSLDRTKLYSKAKAADSWAVRGVGPLRIFKNKESGQVRAVVRSEPNGLVVLNTPLQTDIKYNATTDRTVMFVGRDEKATDDNKVSVFMVRTQRPTDLATRMASLAQ